MIFSCPSRPAKKVRKFLPTRQITRPPLNAAGSHARALSPMLASPPPTPRMAPGELRSPPPSYRVSQVVPLPLSPPPSMVGSSSTSGPLMSPVGRIGGAGGAGGVNSGGGGGGVGGVMEDSPFLGSGLESGGGGSSRSLHTTPRRSPYPQVGMGGSSRDLRALPYYPGMTSPSPAFQQQSLSLRSPGFMQSLKQSHPEGSLPQVGGGDGPNTPTAGMDSSVNSGRRNSASVGGRSSGGGERRGSMIDTPRSEPSVNTRRIKWADENNKALEEYCYFDESYSPPIYTSSEGGVFSCLPWLCCCSESTAKE